MMDVAVTDFKALDQRLDDSKPVLLQLHPRNNIHPAASQNCNFPISVPND